jgi:hypothetical protein
MPSGEGPDGRLPLMTETRLCVYRYLYRPAGLPLEQKDDVHFNRAVRGDENI